MNKEKEFADNSIIEMFGLTYEQTLLMFSAQLMLAKYDCKLTKDKKNADFKEKWIREWERAISSSLHEANNTRAGYLYLEDGLAEKFKVEIEKSYNKTWYYIVVLELLEFVAYTPLGTKNDNQYRKCKYDDKKTIAFLKEFILNQGYLSEEKINRLDKTYNKSLSQISGKAGKIVKNILAVVAVGGVGAAIAAVNAGAIAVMLVGSLFENLHGAALVAACLAYIGGGAIAAGGAGMAGGVAVIAGGGGLLGIAGSGAAIGAGNMILSSAPEFTLTQAAKLETILKEVILNTQQDVAAAQKIIALYKQQIVELNRQLSEMELENEKTKEELNNIKTCIKYLKKSFDDMRVFTSAYEVGMQTEG